MRPNVVRARPLKVYLVLFSLVAVVACFTPSHAQQKNSSGSSSGNGFGKKDNADANKKTQAATTAAATPEQRFLDPFALELVSGEGDNNGERKVRSLTDRSPGDILLEIPSEDILSVERIRSRLAASCGSNGNDGEEKNYPEDEEEALALGLLRLKYEAQDSYVSNIFPKKHFNVWTLPRDLWKEMSAVLPRCYSETFDATRRRVNTFATQAASASAAGDAAAASKKKTNHQFTVDDALWAFSMVRSRSLAVPELNDDNGENDRIPLAVIPGLDLLNHEFGCGTQLQLVADDDDQIDDNKSNSKSKWVVSSPDSIQAGDEVFLSYGDDKDNWKLLLTYGFAVPNNPNVVVFWTWRDLLDAAHVVRPGTFTDPVCRQLLRHPQLEAYTVKSENRATFSYDAHTNTPRESLSNGLTMLNSLAAQLGKPETEKDALSNQVLETLRRRRLEELREGQTLLIEQQEERKQQPDKHEAYLEWKPFFDSLRLALESEQQQLLKTQIQ